MTYSPKPGDIGLTSISGWGGRGIRAAQKLVGCGWSDPQHAYVVTSVDADGTVWIVEAMPEGARHVKNWHTDVVYLRCPDRYRSAVAAAALKLAEKKTPYSWLDYTAVGTHRIHLPVPGLKHYIETSGHMMCSQLADRAAHLGGWQLFDDGRWEGYVPPCDLNVLYVAQRAQRIKSGDMSI